MDPNLMGPSGFYSHSKSINPRGVPFQEQPFGQGRFAPNLIDGHFFSIDGVPADRTSNDSLSLRGSLPRLGLDTL